MHSRQVKCEYILLAEVPMLVNLVQTHCCGVTGVFEGQFSRGYDIEWYRGPYALLQIHNSSSECMMSPLRSLETVVHRRATHALYETPTPGV